MGASVRRIYISGPMTGLPGHNFGAFFEAERHWIRWGWLVENPARNSQQSTRAQYMRMDYERILRSDAIAMLPGWQDSEGAKSELNKAYELDLEVFDAITGLPYEARVVLTAEVDCE